MRKLNFIGAACGLGAKQMETQLGPKYLKGEQLKPLLQEQGLKSSWQAYLEAPFECPAQKAQELQEIVHFNKKLSSTVARHSSETQFPIIIGGDHSIAMGSWAGITQALKAKRKFGLLWIDAHLDAHTFVTTPSQAVHGMPVAALLGYGDPCLLEISGEPSISPAHLVLFGARSYESGEHELLKKLGVKIFYQQQLAEMGLAAAFQQALHIVRQAPLGFGLSIDLDAFDPEDAPGVGSPELNGIRAAEFLPLLKGLGLDPACKALELVEYNPLRDIDNKTQLLIAQLIKLYWSNEKENAL